MKVRDLIRYSFELVLPEKAVDAFDRRVASAPRRPADRPSERRGPAFATLRQTLEQIDIARHGGLTFGPEAIERMTIALDGVIAALPHPAEASQIPGLAEHILDIAADGVRDPERLKTMALEAFEKEPNAPIFAPAPESDVLAQDATQPPALTETAN
jgi:hypothetical protein